MRNIFGVVLVALVLSGPGALAEDKAAPSTRKASPKEDETLTLKRGETKRFTFPGVTRVAVGDPEIADITVDAADTLTVKGGSEGKTTLLVWTADKARRSYLIHVK
jgi:pilus assembly protein CpaC